MESKSILIIEDDKDLVEAWKLVLESEGYRVRHASNGKQGLDAIKAERPDIIILDVMMDSRTEGFHVAYKLRSKAPDSEFASYRNIPILLVSAIHETTEFRFDDDVKTEWLPVDDFVEKPVQPKELLSIIERMLKVN